MKQQNRLTALVAAAAAGISGIGWLAPAAAADRGAVTLADAAGLTCRAAPVQAAWGAGRAARAHAPAGPRPPLAVIRVDQIGYPAGAAKLAEIMTTGSERRGVGWVLVRAGSRAGSCAVVAHGRATVDLGSWSHRYGHVWAVRFSAVRAPGRYRLVLAGDPAVRSPWFLIGPASRLYARPLANALSFYQNERDGPDFIPSALRTAPGDLNDAHAMTYRTPPVNGNGNFKGSLRRYSTGVAINADGGWFDAGDNLKFVETTSYTVAVMLQGIESFPDSLGRHGQVSFVREARFGLDFLQRMWNEQTRTLYYQVGTGEANSYYFGDHDIWRLPQADDHYGGTNPRYRYIRHPPVFRSGKPGSLLSPNLAGRLAADFALCFRVFVASAPRYADRCLRSAETVYALADTHPRGHLLTAAPFDFYPETSWRDDMMLGATELALALHVATYPVPVTGRPVIGHAAARPGQPAALPAGLPVRSAAVYLRDAARWARAWIGSRADRSDTLNLYDVSALGDYELYRAIGAAGRAPARGVPAGGAAVRAGQVRAGQVRAARSSGRGGLAQPGRLPITRAALLADLRAQIRRAIGIGRDDPFRFGFAWNQFDTTAHGFGLAVMAGEYDALAGRPAFASWGQRWLDDVLGSNAWGVSLVVGDGTVFPDCMQHQIANLVGSHDGRPPVLAGAVVEGTNSFAATGTVPNMRPCVADAAGGVPYSTFNGHHAVFADNVQSYSTVEPAIDLTVLSPLAFAWQEAGPRAGF
ncbi:MAG TPA: glycoside hydrolase family 9 protein [Streptosporangiaceae bacterium]|nr:glycoside hydrolase family 9 protein [Streptosporangiaceae bacterium]